MQKKQFSLLKKFKFAWNGIKIAFLEGKNFRIQFVLGITALALLAVTKANPYWWAIFCIIIGAVLAMETFNTALEKALDHLHPSEHPLVGAAKDCAAGAVLLLSITSLFILVAYLAHILQDL